MGKYYLGMVASLPDEFPRGMIREEYWPCNRMKSSILLLLGFVHIVILTLILFWFLG